MDWIFRSNLPSQFGARLLKSFGASLPPNGVHTLPPLTENCISAPISPTAPSSTRYAQTRVPVSQNKS